MTRRGFLAALTGVPTVALTANQRLTHPVIVGVLAAKPGDGRLFRLGRWTLIADPEVPDYALAAVLDLQQTLVAVGPYRTEAGAV